MRLEEIALDKFAPPLRQQLGSRLLEVERGDYLTALRGVERMAGVAVSRSRSARRPLVLPELDITCQEIGQRVSAQLTAETRKKKAEVVIIATIAYRAGGHSRLIEDYVRALGSEDCLLIFTDPTMRRATDTINVDCEVAVLDQQNELDRLKSLLKMLRDYNPKAIFNFAHPSDAIAMAAMQPSLARQGLFFVHHADHGFTLGACLRGTTHIDLHPRAALTCEVDFGIKGAYVPLAASREPGLPKVRSTKNIFISCSAGHSHKIEPAESGNPRFWDIIARVVEIKRGIHFHFGTLTSEEIGQAERTFLDRGLMRESLVRVEHVSCLSEALYELNTDLYINTFPLGGGRSVVEAMAAAAPICTYDNPKSALLSGIDLIYREALIWRTTAVLDGFIRSLDETQVERHRHLSWSHYARYNSMQTQRDQLLSVVAKIDVDRIPAPAVRCMTGATTDIESFFVEIE